MMEKDYNKFFKYCENNIDFAKKVIELNDCADNYIGCDMWYSDGLYLKDGLNDHEAELVLNDLNSKYVVVWNDFIELCNKNNLNPEIALELGVSKEVKGIIEQNKQVYTFNIFENT